MSSEQEATQPKVAWNSDTSDLCWISPSTTTGIESLIRSHFQLSDDACVAATLFLKGPYYMIYTVAIPGVGDNISSHQYILRVTWPVEPFYKTASEVATLSCLREHTTIPVPGVIAHSSSAENELGCEWILMERIAGVALSGVWRDIDLETKREQTKTIAGFVRQLRGLRHHFPAIGNLYFRDDIYVFNGTAPVPSTKDDRYVIGPIVTPLMFEGGRKLQVQRNLGPYPTDAEYITALVAPELEEMKLLLSGDAREYEDFDKYLAEDAEEIISVLNELQPISEVLFPSRHGEFNLHHHDLSLDDILVDPKTYEILSIVDWESVGTRPHWEDTYPLFLEGKKVEGKVEPLAPGETNDYRVERWENWEKMQLRPVFASELGEEVFGADDGEDEMRRGFMEKLKIVESSQKMVRDWMKMRPELAWLTSLSNYA